MSNLERIHKILKQVRRKGAVPMSALMEELETSESSVKREIEYMQTRLDCPIKWDRKRRGWMLDETPERPYELPGLWFNASELHALVAVQALLRGLEPGLLEPRIRPLQKRIENLIGEGAASAADVHRRIKIIQINRRRTDASVFEKIASAVISRKRLRIRHLNRETQAVTSRDVSPQQLLHYRENWFLDAWCHLRSDIRTFGLDAIQAVEVLEVKSEDIPSERLEAHFKLTYGIYAGEPKFRARLRFTAERAQWVALETWHENQIAKFEPDGSYVLEIPYSHDHELVMDLLRHGDQVEVLAPIQLRQKLGQIHQAAAQKNLAQPLE